MGPDDALFDLALVYDRYFDATFHGSQAVSLCVYIVGGLPDGARGEHVEQLREMHDSTLVLDPDQRLTTLPRRDSN